MMRKIIVTILALMLLLIAGCNGGFTGGATSELYDTLDCGLTTSIELLEINDIQQACYKDSYIYFTIENTGNTYIKGLRVFLESEYDVMMKLLKPANAGETVEYSITFGDQRIEEIKSITLKPIIGTGMRSAICDSASLTVDIQRC